MNALRACCSCALIAASSAAASAQPEAVNRPFAARRIVSQFDFEPGPAEELIGFAHSTAELRARVEHRQVIRQLGLQLLTRPTRKQALVDGKAARSSEYFGGVNVVLFAPEDLPRNVYYGDGTPIEDEVVEALGKLYDRESKTFEWQDGDLVMIDNMLVAHARLPYTGPRKIVVAMGEMFDAVNLPALSAS